MSNAITPTPNSYFKSSISTGDKYSSIAELSKRVYPLNLNRNRQETKHKRQSSGQVEMPEFASEYVKGAIRPKSKPTPMSSIGHNRSASYNYTPKAKPEPMIRHFDSFRIPQLSYKQFRVAHRSASNEKRIYKAQAIQLTKRAKIVLHSAKPINISPGIYHSRRKTEGSYKIRAAEKKEERNENGVDLNNVIGPGMTYGEKILRLKALVANTLF
jgi:hypothetical protein